MIEQCLSNKNESATVAKNLNFCQLNKAWRSVELIRSEDGSASKTQCQTLLGPCLVPKKTKKFQDSLSYPILQHMHEALKYK